MSTPDSYKYLLQIETPETEGALDLSEPFQGWSTRTTYSDKQSRCRIRFHHVDRIQGQSSYQRVLHKQPLKLCWRVAEIPKKHSRNIVAKHLSDIVQRHAFVIWIYLRKLMVAQFMKGNSHERSVISGLGIALNPKKVKQLLSRDKKMRK